MDITTTSKPINVPLGDFEAAVISAGDGLSTPKRDPAPLAIGAGCRGRGRRLLVFNKHRFTHSCARLVIGLDQAKRERERERAG